MEDCFSLGVVHSSMYNALDVTTLELNPQQLQVVGSFPSFPDLYTPRSSFELAIAVSCQQCMSLLEVEYVCNIECVCMVQVT